MPTDAYIMSLREYLLRKFNRRNELFRQLRGFYNSEYWAETEQQGIKLIYNKVGLAVDRYTDFMIQPPDWQVIPTDVTTEARKQAETQEKYLYCQYAKNHIGIVHGWLVNLQAQLGMFALEARPHFGSKEKFIHLDVPIPEYVLPYPKSDNMMDLEAVVILGDMYEKQGEQFNPDVRAGERIRQANLTKYYDKDSIIVLKDGKRIAEVNHEFGFIPLVIGQNKVKPHYVEGLGDMDQSAGLQIYLNDLLSYQADIIEYAANPITVIKGYVGDNLPTGPRAQWHLGRDMDASFLTWPGSPPAMEQMYNKIERAIDDGLNVSDALAGRDLPSGTSGSAVQSLLSGIQATFLRKQVHLGYCYVRMNEIMFRIHEKYFKNEEVILRGVRKNNIFVAKTKGEYISGNYETRAIFPPGVLDQPARINVEITKLNAGVQSKYTTMENIGVQSPLDEMELIRIEQEEMLERELMAKGAATDKTKEYQDLAANLDRSGAGFGSGAEQGLIEAIAGIPKIKGDVLFGGQDGQMYTIVLTEMKDKATIVNRLPAQLKGKVKFRAYKDEDSDLTPIVSQKEEANAA